MEAAAAKGLVKKTKVNVSTAAEPKPVPNTLPVPTPEEGLEATAAAALLTYQNQSILVAKSAPAETVPESSANDASNSNWAQLLERSNKLTANDRERIRQFFVDRYNPTPSTSLYRIKLHEERTTEQESGAQVKETLYLDLDYNTFGFKKLKKTKRK